MPTLTQTQLKQILEYDPLTGLFKWLRNGEYAGKMNKAGYISICFNSKSFLAHRLAWLYMTGEWPQYTIDHKDRVRNNNIFTNLKDVTQGDNSRNRLSIPGLRIYHNRIAGSCSAHYKLYGKERAEKWVYLGSFKNEEEAIEKFKQVSGFKDEENFIPL